MIRVLCFHFNGNRPLIVNCPERTESCGMIDQSARFRIGKHWFTDMVMYKSSLQILKQFRSIFMR